MSELVMSDRLRRISRHARVYPGWLLPYGGTGLILFAAAFYGRNDAIHFARKHMACDCVDVDATNLNRMRAVYPDTFTFHHGDAWEFATGAAGRCESWDVVSVDPFLGDAAARASDTINLWCRLACHLVTLTIEKDQVETIDIPAGWAGDYLPRTLDGRVGWLILQPSTEPDR
jgi:hypothetical protein